MEFENDFSRAKWPEHAIFTGVLAYAATISQCKVNEEIRDGAARRAG